MALTRKEVLKKNFLCLLYNTGVASRHNNNYRYYGVIELYNQKKSP